MYAWGQSQFWQTCLGTQADQLEPAACPQVSVNFANISCGTKFVLALSTDGDLYSWGTGVLGELGLAYSNVEKTPVKIVKVPADTKFKAISAGHSHSLAISEAGDIYVWGSNDSGQLGTGNLKPLDRPTKLKIGQKFAAVSAGHRHNLALTEHGLAYTWGAGWASQNTEAEGKTLLTPKLISEDIIFKFVLASEHCSVAITNRGKVYTWGAGGHGRLGHGDAKPQVVPKVIEHLIKTNVVATKIAAGQDHMLLLSDKGELWSWGGSAHGETAQSSTLRRMVPHPVKFRHENPIIIPPTPVIWNHGPFPSQITAAATTKSSNSDSTPVDQTNGNTTPNADSSAFVSSTPHIPVSKALFTPVPGPDPIISGVDNPVVHGPFVDIAAGHGFCLAINQRGELYSWGKSHHGVLGNGAKEGDVMEAIKVSSHVQFSKVFAGPLYAIALGSGEGAPIAQLEIPTVVPAASSENSDDQKVAGNPTASSSNTSSST